MKMKKMVTRIVALCLAALVGVTSFPVTGYAAAPTINTKFTQMKLGTTQFKMDYYDYESVIAGCFTAPSSGKYSVYTVNNGELDYRAYMLDKNMEEIESADYAWEVETHEKYTFRTISLKKGEKVYFYIEGAISTKLMAAKFVIKQVSGTPCLNKTKASIKQGKSTTLKMKYNKKPIIWVSGKKSVATVSSKGVVKGKKKGTAYIYAIANHKLYKCKVTVK